MKKLKILASITLTTILATSAVLAWTDLGTVSDSDPLTSTLWNNTITRINEIATKLTENSTPPVFHAQLTSNQSPATEILLTAWSEKVDNKNAFNNGIYTIPKAGYYRISYEGLFKNAGVTTYYGYISLYINNSLRSRGQSSLGSTMSYGPIVGINDIYNLNVGDTIELRGYTNNVLAFFYSTIHSHYTIEYIGE